MAGNKYTLKINSRDISRIAICIFILAIAYAFINFIRVEEPALAVQEFKQEQYFEKADLKSTTPATVLPSNISTASDTEPTNQLRDTLEDTLTIQMEKAEEQTGGAVVAVAIVIDGELVVVGNTEEIPIINSASMAKTYWVAAALDQTDVATVEQFAVPIFTSSDNLAAGQVINLVSTPEGTHVDAVNEWTNSIGLEHTRLNNWRLGTDDGGLSSDATLESFNQTTVTDAVNFLDSLNSGNLFDDQEKTDQLLEWMTLSPDSGQPLAAPIPELLPQEVASQTAHKAGWLPNSGVLNDFAIIPLPDGQQMSIAFTTDDGNNYAGQSQWISETTCAVYTDLAATDHSCSGQDNSIIPIQPEQPTSPEPAVEQEKPAPSTQPDTYYHTPEYYQPPAAPVYSPTIDYPFFDQPIFQPPTIQQPPVVQLPPSENQSPVFVNPPPPAASEQPVINQPKTIEPIPEPVKDDGIEYYECGSNLYMRFC